MYPRGENPIAAEWVRARPNGCSNRDSRVSAETASAVHGSRFPGPVGSVFPSPLDTSRQKTTARPEKRRRQQSRGRGTIVDQVAPVRKRGVVTRDHRGERGPTKEPSRRDRPRAILLGDERVRTGTSDFPSCRQFRATSRRRLRWPRPRHRRPRGPARPRRASETSSVHRDRRPARVVYLLCDRSSPASLHGARARRTLSRRLVGSRARCCSEEDCPRDLIGRGHGRGHGTHAERLLPWHRVEERTEVSRQGVR